MTAQDEGVIKWAIHLLFPTHAQRIARQNERLRKEEELLDLKIAQKEAENRIKAKKKLLEEKQS